MSAESAAKAVSAPIGGYYFLNKERVIMGLFDKKSILDQVNKFAQKASEFTQKTSDAYVNSRIEHMPANTQGHSMYEQFASSGIGKTYVFTESSLIYDNVEYPYAQLSGIVLKTPPTAITGGVAQTTVDGRVLSRI